MTSQASPRKRIRLADIAERANVSKVTVAKVLHKTGGKNTRVSEKTAVLVRKIAEELNYRPNLVARQLVGKKSKLVGVLVDSMGDEFIEHRVANIEHELRMHGYRTFIGRPELTLEAVSEYLDDFEGYGSEGLVCITQSFSVIPQDLRKRFQQSGNVVFFKRSDRETAGFPHVCSDVSLGVEMLVDHLVEQGRKRISYLMSHQEYYTPDMKSRRIGYIRGLENHGMEFDENLYLDAFMKYPWPEEKIAEAVSELIKRGTDAIITLNDLVACRILRVLSKMGVRVPDDVAVAGFDNMLISSLIQPTLTTIDHNDNETAKRLVETLLNMINGTFDNSGEIDFLVKPQLVVRESTASSR